MLFRSLVQHGTAITKAIVRSIDGALDLEIEHGGKPQWTSAEKLTLNDIGRVRLALASPLPIDNYRENRTTGAFIIVDESDGWTLGAGMAGSTPFTAPTPSTASSTVASSTSTGGTPGRGPS